MPPRYLRQFAIHQSIVGNATLLHRHICHSCCLSRDNTWYWEVGSSLSTLSRNLGLQHDPHILNCILNIVMSREWPILFSRWVTGTCDAFHVGSSEVTCGWSNTVGIQLVGSVVHEKQSRHHQGIHGDSTQSIGNHLIWHLLAGTHPGQ